MGLVIMEKNMKTMIYHLGFRFSDQGVKET